MTACKAEEFGETTAHRCLHERSFRNIVADISVQNKRYILCLGILKAVDFSFVAQWSGDAP